MSLSSLKEQYIEAEKTCSGLEAKVNQLQQANDGKSHAVDEELVALQTENGKLKYRIEILTRTLEEMAIVSQSDRQINDVETNVSIQISGCMANMREEIQQLFDAAIAILYPTLQAKSASITSSQFADYQCNSAMQLAKMLKSKKLKSASPKEIAKEILKAIPDNEVIGVVDVADPGFINIRVADGYIKKKICESLVDGIKVTSKFRGERVIVDYSSPNIAKEMHVGHLRSTIIGDCIANLFEFIGCDVLRLNHVGDWGTQFGMLLAHLVDKYPDFVTTPPPISDLQVFYKEAKARFDADESFKSNAYACVVKLQAKEPAMYKAWQQICEISRSEFEQIYKALGINGLTERGESYYHDLMKGMVDDLESRNLLVEDDGRKIMWPEQGKIPPLTIVKTDGGFTYDTSDMACLRQRIDKEKASRIIYVTDAGQAVHFQAIFQCCARAEYLDPNKVRVDHVGFGVVLGQDKKKFQTRSGETVRLKDLLEEGLERALAKLKEKNRHEVLSPVELVNAQKAVAFGCIKYADLSHDRNREYEFSFDRMLDDRGNTAVYLLYSLTRIRSIIRNANLAETVEDLASLRTQLNLTHQREIRLAKCILRLPEIILTVAQTLFPHELCGYLFDLSVIFSEFYDQCYCIEKSKGENGEEIVNVNIDRILLCAATANVLDKGMQILGIKSVNKM